MVIFHYGETDYFDLKKIGSIILKYENPNLASATKRILEFAIECGRGELMIRLLTELKAF